jgi:hypothetical protein
MKRKELRSISMKELKKSGTNKEYTEMSVKELKAEKARIEVLLELKNDHSSMLRTVELFYSALTSQFLVHINHELPSLYVLKSKRHNIYSLLETVSLFLNRWLYRALKKRPTMSQRSSLYVIYADLILTNIGASNYAPATLRTVLTSYEMFPSLFDRAFPGYANSGAVSFILSTNKISLDAEDLD